MGAMSWWHWLVVLVVVILVFGTKKLRNAGSDLGGAVKSFKDSMRDGDAEASRKPESLGADGTSATESSAAPRPPRDASASDDR